MDSDYFAGIEIVDEQKFEGEPVIRESPNSQKSKLVLMKFPKKSTEHSENTADAIKRTRQRSTVNKYKKSGVHLSIFQSP